MNNHSDIVALDVGKKRTGIARASSVAKLPEPLMSVETSIIEDCLKKIISEHNVEMIAVGLPRSLSGDDTEQTKWVREWVHELKPKISAPMYWQDEALSTVAAEAWMKDSKAGHDIDSHAAAAILEDFLKTPEDSRVPC